MTRQTHLRRIAFVVVAALCALVALASTPDAGHASVGGHRPAADPASTRTDGITHVLGDYDNEIREATPRADGVRHVDTGATIDALRHAHVNTYAYLVWHQKTDWDDLVHEFLPAAAHAQINVWIYLVPPSECCSQPYGDDYVAWADAIARLSKRYPNLTAWVIDDFVSNTATFTPTYMADLQRAAHAVDPELSLFTIVYAGQYTKAFVDDYGPHIDGAIFPYTGAGTSNDLNDTSALISELDAAVSAMKSIGKRLYLMPYAAPYSGSAHPPSAATVAEMIRVGLRYMHQGTLDGVVLYATAKEFADEPCPPIDVRDYLALVAPWSTPTPGGDHVDASQQVTVDPDASSYSVRFLQSDSFKTVPVDAGYYDKQLLVDGIVVWHQDPAADPAATWTAETVDLTSALRGRTSATVTFRLTNPLGVQNFGMTYGVARVEPTGFTVVDGDFTTHDGWTFDSTTQAFTAAYTHETYVCDPQRQWHVYRAVQRGYGPDSLLYRALAAVGVPAGAKAAVVATARTALRLHDGGRDRQAANVTDALARQARAFGLPVLAEQATEVAAELRG